MQYSGVANIPMQKVGPIQFLGDFVNESLEVPLATFETPLWPSTNRGAKVSRLSGGILMTVVSDSMSRSVVFEANNATRAMTIVSALQTKKEEMDQVVSSSSRFAKLKDWHFQVVGNLIYIRFSINSGDASGHNMATHAAELLQNWILSQYSDLAYVSISGNYCTDKKVSAVNGILGRGKYVIGEVTIPRSVCLEVLKTTPEKIVDLHIKKNLIGTMLAGGLRSANAHFANVLLAFYLATGQDAANIIEGSQGFVHAELRKSDLYFSVTLPNVIVGTIGNGKHLDFARDNLKSLGCLDARMPGSNGRRLAAIIGGTVLCGELSLLAAQTNPGELMRTHVQFERNKHHQAELLEGIV